MFGQDAQTLLDHLGLAPKGEMTTAQLPAYLERLKSAIKTDKVANPVIWPELLPTEEEKMNLSSCASPNEPRLWFN